MSGLDRAAAGQAALKGRGDAGFVTVSAISGK